MSTRQARRERRESDRKSKKLAYKESRHQSAACPAEPENAPADVPSTITYEEYEELKASYQERLAKKFKLPPWDDPCEQSGNVPEVHPRLKPENTRAAINRANAENSTGPRTAAGKANSSQNAFKHGLYSKQLVLPGEDPAELDALRSDLRAEHQPANTTEEILVNEIAEQFWRLKRTRRIEADLMNADTIDKFFYILPLIQRTMASAERGFHKALAALSKLQKARGFVPQISAPEPVSAPANGFVPSESAPPPAPDPNETQCVPQNADELAEWLTEVREIAQQLAA